MSGDDSPRAAAQRMLVSVIAAVAENGVIGRAGDLALRIPADLARLKRLTMGHHLVMGRRTWESIGKPLPGRTTIVLSRDSGYRAPGCLTAVSLAEALETARRAGETEAFIMGGGEVYKQAVPAADRLYLTRIHASPAGDTTFPPVGPEWRETAREDHPEGSPAPFTFVDLERAGRDPLEETVLSRRELFRGGYLRLEELAIRLPDGRQGRREVVSVRDAVAVLPVDAAGRVHLVRQHRAAIGRTILEAPAGVIERDEDPEAAARRECEEEIGLRPKRLLRLISYAHAEGYSTGFITLYVGLDLERVESPGLDASEFLEHVVLPFAELREQVGRNEIVDSKTILTTLYWERIRETLPPSGAPAEASARP